MRLVLMMGLPYSGKTTWALDQGVPIVSPDAIRRAFHGERFLEKAEPWIWTATYTMAEALAEAGHETVIVDATHTKAKRRQPWVERFPDAEILVAQVRTQSNECTRRAHLAGDFDILPIIDRMAQDWEEPLGKPIRGSDGRVTYVAIQEVSA